MDGYTSMSRRSVTRALFSRKPNGNAVEKAKLFSRYTPRRGNRTSTVSSSVVREGISGKYTPDRSVGLAGSRMPSTAMENDGMNHF